MCSVLDGGAIALNNTLLTLLLEADWTITANKRAMSTTGCAYAAWNKLNLLINLAFKKNETIY